GLGRTVFPGHARGGGVIPAFEPDLCTDCGGCVGVCPVDAVELFHGQVDITQACIECDLCVKACPTGALTSSSWPPGEADE
ncbi:MAG: 4Fe-4S binding protein, partial [Candidatus Thermoplasmatota archaeon]|nr:4Fe-4S binding protein [Candidatus Thermoplasmatota archaeon]